MSLLQVQMCLMHDMINVFWSSINARNGFFKYKHYSDAKILHRLQTIVQLLVNTSMADEKDLKLLYDRYCHEWNLLFQGKDCWNIKIIENNNVFYQNIYKHTKELAFELCMLAYHMKTL